MKLKELFGRPNKVEQHKGRRDKGVPAQDMSELSSFLRLLVENNVRSYLEIGSKYGGTFNMVMRLLPPGSRGVAVDLPGANWGKSDSATFLSTVVGDLRPAYDVHMIFGNSQSETVKNEVAALGPFDAALIDGDHLYAGAKADWLFYGPMAKLVAFHDVVGEGGRVRKDGLVVEVPKLWREIKETGRPCREFVGRDSVMGIGVVLPD